MESKDMLQLEISYLLNLIKPLPKGWIGEANNRETVFIYSDPDDPTVSRTRRKQYYTDSKNGAYYKPKINKYIMAVQEYKKLMCKWKQTYAGKPKIIDFPINPQIITGIPSSFFNKAVPNQNPHPIKYPIDYKGQILRSKNELLAIQTIESMGFEWKTEVAIRTENDAFFPDAIFNVPYIQKAIALEIDGMMDDQSYFDKAQNRKDRYIEAGFQELKDIIIFRPKNRYDFDAASLKRLIEVTIDINASEIISRMNSVFPCTV